MATGLVLPGFKAPKKKEEPNSYTTSVLQSGQNYDEIMGGYRNILNNPNKDYGALSRQYGDLIRQYQGLAGQGPVQYKRGDELTSAFSNLSQLSQTGGYDPSAIAEIRARGISPIRSVYANAQQNLNRQRALQGGYSPNYGAVTSKMARELSEQIANQVTNVNANIAEKQATGRLAIAPQYAQAAQRETELMNEMASQGQSQQAQLLAALQSLYGQQGNLIGAQDQRQLAALGGMTQLYGTTPANPALYGSQALQREQLAQQDKALNQQASQALMNAYIQSGYRPPQVTGFRLGRGR